MEQKQKGWLNPYDAIKREQKVTEYELKIDKFTDPYDLAVYYVSVLAENQKKDPTDDEIVAVERYIKKIGLEKAKILAKGKRLNIS